MSLTVERLDYRPGLVALVKQVKGKGGKLYSRTYWVRAPDAPKRTRAKKEKPAAEPKVVPAAEQKPAAQPNAQPAAGVVAVKAPTQAAPASGHDAIRARGGDPAHVQAMVGSRKSGWIKNADSEGGTTMTIAASVVFGMDPTVSLNRQRGGVRARNFGNSAKALEQHDAAVARARQAAASPQVQASVRAMAEASQAHYQEGHVTLYRGLRNARDNGDGTVSFATDALSSFTSDPKVARKFAKAGGRVVAVQVPRSAIVASHLAVPELDARGEREVVVASRGAFTGRVLEAGQRAA